MNKLVTIFVTTLILSGCLSDDDKNSYDNINRAPVADDLTVLTQTETPVTDTLPASDADGDSLTFALSAEPQSGVVSVTANGEFTYTPDLEFTGTDSFTFTVSDGTAFAVTGSVTVNIEALEVPVSIAVRAAFTQTPTDKPLAVNGRLYLQDVTNPAEFDDLLTD